MAGGFSFPPPPPPPPKPAAQSQQQDFDYSQQSGRGGRGRGGFESRGRGSGRGRGGGRGNPNFEPTGSSQQSNFNQGHGYARPGGVQETSSQWQNATQRSHFSGNAQPPPGSYVNPNFTGQQQSTGGNATYQSGMSYGGGVAATQNSYAPSSSRGLNASTYPPAQNDGPGRTQAGHKRKLDALRGPQQHREKKQGPQAAPSVPSFGAPILPSAPQAGSTQPPSNAQPGNRPKPGNKALGLTPQDGTLPTYPSESEDEDIDEEAQFAELGTKLTFEHNGEVMTLNNEADLAAWREERRKQFPTMSRVSEKESQRLRVGEERRRLLAAVARLHQAPRNRHAENKTRLLREPARKAQEDAESDVKMEDQPEQSSEKTFPPAIQHVEESSGTAAVTDDTPDDDDNATDMIQHADAGADANVPVEKNNATIQQADADAGAEIDIPTADHTTRKQGGPPKSLPGIDMGDSDDDESNVEAAADEGDQPSGDEAESASSSDSEDDGPPEQTSSKPRPSAASDAQRPVCRYFSASGRCRDGDACRFRHELSSKAPSARPFQPPQDKPAFDRFAPKLDPKSNDRKSIFERLMEQEQQGDDKLALQVIKALGQAGLFAEAETEGGK